jgi:predicted DNA-binding protein with PD1-like motif
MTYGYDRLLIIIFHTHPPLSKDTFMKHCKPLFLLLTFTTIAYSQPILTEKTSPASSSDAKPNSSAVPEVYTINGQFKRVAVVRLKNQTDILAGLESIVKEQKIHNAVILTGIGSVTDYHIHTVGSRSFPTRNIFVKDTTTSADIVNLNGYIIDGRVHAHISLAYADKAIGGHLEPGTKVYTFAIVTIGIFKDGIDLRRVDDKDFR